MGKQLDLIFQNPPGSAGVGTITGNSYLSGCRGFTGPVPPPLWIRTACNYPVQLLGWIIPQRQTGVKPMKRPR